MGLSVMMTNGKTVPAQPVFAKPSVSPQNGRHTILAGCDRVESRISALQVEQAVSSSSWSVQPERFVSIQQPSRDAKLLERAYWHHPVVDVPSTREEAVVLMDCLQRETEARGLSDGTNVVAFTGGNGPALTAYLLDSIFDGSVIGCVGSQTMVSQAQREHAAYVCDLLGIDLVEVEDAMWAKFESVGSDAEDVCQDLAHSPCDEAHIALFSGFTADDVSGSGTWLQGNEIFAPLVNLSHAAVNALSRVVGLNTGTPMVA